MNSISFPKIFTANKTTVLSDEKAVLKNIYLLLHTKLREFYGDPDYGTKTVYQLFKYNSPALDSILIDDIYTTITTYIPQVTISKDDITIEHSLNELYANITLYYNNDTTSTIRLTLASSEETY